MAEELGLEPRLAESKSAVLPLDDPSMSLYISVINEISQPFIFHPRILIRRSSNNLSCSRSSSVGGFSKFTFK